MAKREEATTADVLTTLAEWATNRARVDDERGISRTNREREAALEQLLEDNKSYICGELVKAVKNDSNISRIWLNDVTPELYEFLREVHINRPLLEVLRRWFKQAFGSRIAVEGDSNFAGLYLDLT